MATPAQQLNANFDISVFIADANECASAFLVEAVKEKKAQDEARLSAAREQLEKIIQTADHVALTNATDQLSATTLLFLARAVFKKTDKSLCIKYLEMAYQKKNMSPEEANNIQKNCLVLLKGLIEKDFGYFHQISPLLQVEIVKAIDAVLASAGAESKEMADSVVLMQCFNAGFEDKVKGVTRDQAQETQFRQSIDWLSQQKPLHELTAKELWSLMKQLKVKVTGNSEGIRDKYCFVVGCGFFSGLPYCTQIIESFSDADKATLTSIQSKIMGFAERFGVVDRARAVTEGVLETILVDTYRQGHIQGKPLVLSEPEKALTKRFYDVKPHANHELENAMLQGLEQILASAKTNPMQFAAHLYMLTVDEHPWWDGNGRVARLLSSEVLRRAGIPIPQYPKRREYDCAVKVSLDNHDYGLFEVFMKLRIAAAKAESAKTFTPLRAAQAEAPARVETPAQQTSEKPKAAGSAKP